MLYSIWSTILLYIPTDKAGVKIEQKKKKKMEGSSGGLRGLALWILHHHD